MTEREVKEWDDASTHLAVHGDVYINRNIHLRGAMALESLVVGYCRTKKALEKALQDIEAFEAMKEGVGIRVADLEGEIARLEEKNEELRKRAKLDLGEVY